MRIEESSAEVSGPVDRGSRRRWVDVALPALLELVVAVPTMAVEESWHGRPMIDQHDGLWLVAGVVVAIAFLGGGALAGYRLPAAAAKHAVIATALAVAVMLVGALARRLFVAHEGVPHSVQLLWWLGSGTALVLGAVGSQLGRRLAPQPR
jgi:hypothetical protein